MEQWSRSNNTFSQWTHTESKDFGSVIFIHAYYEPADVMLHIGMNEEGIYLQMTVKLPEEYLIMQSDNFKKYLKQLSHLGDFELGEDHDEKSYLEANLDFPVRIKPVLKILAGKSFIFWGRAIKGNMKS